MPLLNHCQYCGVQSTALETYFQWTVCSGCAVKLHAPQSASASTAEEPQGHKPKRARCNCCERLKPREQLNKFTYDIPTYRARCVGRLVCGECRRAMLTPCTTCGGYLHISAINDAYANGVCFDCRARAERRRAEEKARQQTYYYDFATALKKASAPVHARALAEYAGERLEWPCSKEALKRVWRSAALRTHPDTGGSSEAFRTAKASYDALAEVAK